MAARGARAAEQRHAAAASVTPMDAAGIDRIVAAVGDYPVDLDRAELAADLERIGRLHRAGVDLRNAPAERRRDSNEVVEAAEHLKSLIEDDGRDRRHLRQYSAMLDRLIADAAREASPRLDSPLRAYDPSAFESTVESLARTYNVHFGEAAGYAAHPDDLVPLHGPFIDFAEAALEELGITNAGAPYERTAIATALAKARKR